MTKSNLMPTKFVSKMVAEGGDTASGIILLGVWGELIPAVLGLLGIAWFALRFVNFFRVNVMHKDPWGMR